MTCLLQSSRRRSSLVELVSLEALETVARRGQPGASAVDHVEARLAGRRAARLTRNPGREIVVAVLVAIFDPKPLAELVIGLAGIHEPDGALVEAELPGGLEPGLGAVHDVDPARVDEPGVVFVRRPDHQILASQGAIEVADGERRTKVVVGLEGIGHAAAALVPGVIEARQAARSAVEDIDESALLGA